MTPEESRFNVPNLRRMLTNRTYVGQIEFEGAVYKGEHDGIISPRIFKEVQRVLAENRRDTRPSSANRHGALLRGLLQCAACGAPMTHAPTTKNGRLYRYYRCGSVLRRGAGSCSTKPLPAVAVEAFVVDQIRRVGADPALQRATFEQAVAQVAAEGRGLRAERKRVERDLVAARAEVERLVGTLSRTTGSAADAVGAQLEKVQGSVAVLDGRLSEVRALEATLAAQHVDAADVTRALEAFDPIWDVLLIPERERVLRLLIAGIRYDGSTGRLDIDWRLAGFGELAKEVGGG